MVRRHPRILTPENMRKFQGSLGLLMKAASEAGMSPAELAIRFCVSNRNVSSVICGIRTAGRVRENAACGKSLPKDLLEHAEITGG